MSLYFHTQHREVVTLFRTIGMTHHVRFHHLYSLLGADKVMLLQHLQQQVVTVLLLLVILRLVQSVTIDEERTATDIIDGLTFVWESGLQTERCIRLHLDEMGRAVRHLDNWRVMSGITEIEASCR